MLTDINCAKTLLDRKVMTRFDRAIVIVVTVLFGMVPFAQARAAGDYLLATASPGGTYYPVGVALSTLVKVKLQHERQISMTAVSSAGSAENVRLLAEDSAQFALLQGLYGAHARQGTGPLVSVGPQADLRAVTMLWQNVEHFLISERPVRTGTIDDALAISGRAGFGKRDSGSLGSSRTLFANLGVDIDAEFDIFYGGYGALADALQDGKADLIGTPAGVPVAVVTKLLAANHKRVRLLMFDAQQAAKADGGLNLWSPYVIPAETYPGQESPIRTIAQPNFLAVRADVPEEDVYLITKTIFENLGFLRSIHQATRDVAVATAIAGLPMPLHPGAARYFREAGLKIPDSLIAR